MIEYDVIQTRGFHNIEENGQVLGFQFCVRINTYRGVWLSMLRPEDVIVDGEIYKKEDIIWNIDGMDYTYDDMLGVGNVQAPNSKPIALKINKPGGLSQGYHEVQFALRLIMSYIPPRVNSDEAFANTTPRYESKRMLIV